MALLLMLASVVLAVTMPAKPTPIAGLHYLVGSWNCVYRAGTVLFPYQATYVYDRDGHTLREVDTFAGGGAEELIAYDLQHRAWNIVVFDDQGTTTVMRGAGDDPNHVAYRSVYPDTGIADKMDRISSTEYTLHATVRAGGKTTVSVDTCMRTK